MYRLANSVNFPTFLPILGTSVRDLCQICCGCISQIPCELATPFNHLNHLTHPAFLPQKPSIFDMQSKFCIIMIQSGLLHIFTTLWFFKDPETIHSPGKVKSKRRVWQMLTIFFRLFRFFLDLLFRFFLLFLIFSIFFKDPETIHSPGKVKSKRRVWQMLSKIFLCWSFIRCADIRANVTENPMVAALSPISPLATF